MIFRGLHLLELGAGAASPVASRYFAEQGAVVLRVESARRPDFLRLLHVTPENRDLDAAPMFALLNPDKLSLTLDLKQGEAVRLAERLADWADVVSENFSPGVMERFGLAPERLRERNPELIVVSGSLFGRTGPQRHYPGFGGQGSAIAGFNHLTGWPDAEAVGPYGTITDSLSPRYVALAIAAALLRRRRTGRGCAIDLSQIETGVYSLSEMLVRWSANGEIVTRNGNRSERDAPHGVYPSRGEDRWIAIAARDDAEWAALAACVAQDWARDPRLATAAARRSRSDELDQRLAAWTRDFGAAELAERLQAAGVPAAPVQDLGEVLDDPQLAHRGHFATVPHPVLGALRCERSGLRLGASPGRLERAGPLLGEHNQLVLRDVLGLSPAEIERLVAEGVVV
jgi:benzylsuccinate CoA-transferase BbsF subunit